MSRTREHTVLNKGEYGVVYSLGNTHGAEQGSIRCRTREHTLQTGEHMGSNKGAYVANKGAYGVEQGSIWYPMFPREHTVPFNP